MSEDGRPDVIYEKFPAGHYAVFTMNRPERLNASGGNLPRLLDEALADFTADLVHVRRHHHCCRQGVLRRNGPPATGGPGRGGR